MMAAPGLLTILAPGRSPDCSVLSVTGPQTRSQRNPGAPARSGRWQQHCRLQLRSSVLDAWEDWRSSSGNWFLAVSTKCWSTRQHKPLKLAIVNEIGGQYEETFGDVDKHLLDYFTFKAVKTVLAQLLEMNPGQYTWFYSFVVNNQVQDGKRFLRVLVKERQELGERVMITRLHLFNKWVKKYDHTNMHKYISDENVELLRERLMQTVKFVSEGDNTEKST